MTAEFLFAFTMVIGSGMLIFGLTFALTTVEIAQYIVWSAARAHAVGNKTVTDSEQAARNKYTNLTAAFPLLTGEGADSPWFRMAKANEPNDFAVGDITDSIKKQDNAIDKDNATDPGGEARHPWIGVESSIDLILFKGLQVPFLGKVTESPQEFKFPIRGVLFRHPSYKECRDFFSNKFAQGVKILHAENGSEQTTHWEDLADDPDSAYSPMEDNGC